MTITPKVTSNYEISGSSFTLKCYGIITPATSPTDSSKITIQQILTAVTSKNVAQGYDVGFALTDGVATGPLTTRSTKAADAVIPVLDLGTDTITFSLN